MKCEQCQKEFSRLIPIEADCKNCGTTHNTKVCAQCFDKLGAYVQYEYD